VVDPLTEVSSNPPCRSPFPATRGNHIRAASQPDAQILPWSGFSSWCLVGVEPNAVKLVVAARGG
jgi:hypothetical protein